MAMTVAPTGCEKAILKTSMGLQEKSKEAGSFVHGLHLYSVIMRSGQGVIEVQHRLGAIHKP